MNDVKRLGWLRQAWLWTIMAIFGYLSSACNGLFYQPDNVLYTTPSEYGISYEARSVVADDGTRLASWTLKPEGQAKGTVLHFHGNAQNMTAHFLFVAWLVKEGYRVVVFDYRGYGQSEGTPDRMGVFKDARAMLEDVCAAEASTQGPTFVLGQSLGTAIAVPAIASLPRTCIKGLMLESAFASYRELARLKLSELWLTWPLQWPLSYLVSDELSPVQFASQLKLPLLMIHGDQDHVVPLSEGRKLFEAYSQGPKTWWTLAGAGHTAAFGDEHSPYRQRLLEWLGKLGG